MTWVDSWVVFERLEDSSIFVGVAASEKDHHNYDYLGMAVVVALEVLDYPASLAPVGSLH